MPLHDSYVAPAATHTGNYLTAAVNFLRQIGAAGHASLVQSLRDTCPQAKKKTSGILLGSVKATCKRPAEAVNATLWTILIIVGVIWRRRILNTITRIILFPFRLLWYMTPLPLLFGKKRPNVPPAENGTTNGTTNGTANGARLVVFSLFVLQASSPPNVLCSSRNIFSQRIKKEGNSRPIKVEQGAQSKTNGKRGQ